VSQDCSAGAVLLLLDLVDCSALSHSSTSPPTRPTTLWERPLPCCSSVLVTVSGCSCPGQCISVSQPFSILPTRAYLGRNHRHRLLSRFAFSEYAVNVQAKWGRWMVSQEIHGR
jgi:hypothetical protein